MAVQIIGIGFFIQKICMYIGMYLQQCIIVRVSSLIGEMKRDKACQLIVDIFRISIIFSFITTIMITFISRPLMNFAGCTPDLIEQCNLLVISTIAGLPFVNLFHIAKKMIPIPFYTFSVGSICIFLVNFFIAVGKPLYSNLTSFVQLISICIGSKILSMKFPNDPLKQMYSYVISDLSTFALTVVLFFITLIPLIKKSGKQMIE